MLSARLFCALPGRLPRPVLFLIRVQGGLAFALLRAVGLLAAACLLLLGWSPAERQPGGTSWLADPPVLCPNVEGISCPLSVGQRWRDEGAIK